MKIGDDMVILQDMDTDDDMDTKWSEAYGRATDHQKNYNEH